MRDADFPEGMLAEWAAIFDSKHSQRNRRSFSLADEVFKWSCTMPLQRRRELMAMMGIAATIDPRIVMEIGCDKGGTLLHWIICHPNVRKVIACEFRGCPIKELFEKQFPDVEFLWLEESSYAPPAAEKVKAFLGGEKLDVVFIDGDKSAFRKDFDIYSPMVRLGGLVFMHDVYDRSGRSACAQDFRTLCQSRLASTVIDLTESIQAKQRARAGVPSSGCHEDWLRSGGDDCGFGVFYIE